MQDTNYKDIYTTNIFPEQQKLTNIAEYSVSEISSAVKRMVEENFEYVRVRGEISGLKIASSGHAYFNLKDPNAILSCTCWRHALAKISIKPEDGMEVIAVGKITTYPGQSKYQMTVESIEIAGIGALMQQFEKLKAVFLKEGLFDADKKKPIPFLPQAIGVITSITGAVIRDIMHRIEDRCPVNVIIWPVTVQGTSAAGEIVEAIKGFNSYKDIDIPKVDIIIVARGGGSIEDLWAFNEEIVVRAASSSNIPLISAIGHETDYTLLDFVADLRAPTPTAAAELAVPVHSQLRASIIEVDYRLTTSFSKYINFIQNSYRCAAAALPNALELILSKEQRLDDLYMRLKDALPKLLTLKFMSLSRFSLNFINPGKLIQFKRQILDNEFKNITFSLNRKLDKASHKIIRFSNFTRPLQLEKNFTGKVNNFNRLSNYLEQVMQRLIEKKATKITMYTTILNSLDYRRVLKRGFTIVKRNNKVLASIKEVEAGNIEIEFVDGSVKASIEDI